MASNKTIEQFLAAIPDKRTAKQVMSMWLNRFVFCRTQNAVNVTATATVKQIADGVITSTSAAAVALTTPSATDLANYLGLKAGSMIEFVVDNSAGANTVTVTLGAGITAPVGAVTGGNTLTVTTTHKVGVFCLYFTSATAAVIFRYA
jgi:hypothetical protein